MGSDSAELATEAAEDKCHIGTQHGQRLEGNLEGADDDVDIASLALDLDEFVGDGDQGRQHLSRQGVGPAFTGPTQGDKVVLILLRRGGAFGGLIARHKAALGKLIQERQQRRAGLAEEQHRGGRLVGAVLELCHRVRDREQLFIGAELLERGNIDAELGEGKAGAFRFVAGGVQDFVQFGAGAGDFIEARVAELRDL